MNADERLAIIQRKVERAKSHFKDLEIVKDAFIKTEPYTIGCEPDPKPGHEGLHRFFLTSLGEIDPNIALIAGDIVHNLRSALDHLACQLVLVNGQPIADETGFPIFKGTEINEATFARKVKGMTVAAKDRIRATEPYKNGKGGDLWVLHKLDIADKHHTLLTTLVHVGGVEIPSKGGLYNFLFPAFAVPNFGDALEIGKPFFTCKLEEYENLRVTFDVGISEENVFGPKSILWVMDRLIVTVDNVILNFKSELA